MAVKNHNIAATSLCPSWLPLNAKTVLEYVFIAEFDFLCDSQQQLHMQGWVQPVECAALASSYFKLECSKEEIVHVNIEACSRDNTKNEDRSMECDSMMII